MHLCKRVLRGPTNGGAYIWGCLKLEEKKSCKTSWSSADQNMFCIYCRSYMKKKKMKSTIMSYIKFSGGRSVVGADQNMFCIYCRSYMKKKKMKSTIMSYIKFSGGRIIWARCGGFLGAQMVLQFKRSFCLQQGCKIFGLKQGQGRFE